MNLTSQRSWPVSQGRKEGRRPSAAEGMCLLQLSQAAPHILSIWTQYLSRHMTDLGWPPTVDQSGIFVPSSQSKGTLQQSTSRLLLARTETSCEELRRLRFPP